MRIQDLFIHSNAALATVVRRIGPDQWDLELPSGLTSGAQDLRTTIGYHAFDDAWVPAVLAGKTSAEVGDAFDPLLTPSDPQAEYLEKNAVASDAVAGFDDLDAVVHLSYGDFPAREYLQHIVSFRFVRAWDIATVIGTTPEFGEEYLLAIESEFAPHLAQYRAMGIFPDPIEISADADTVTRVMASFGRV